MPIFTTARELHEQLVEVFPRCDLCDRWKFTKYIKFDGNTFNACKACRDYLSTPYTITTAGGMNEPT